MVAVARWNQRTGSPVTIPKRIKPHGRRTEPVPRHITDSQAATPTTDRPKIKPARILVPATAPIPATYCWRDSWLTGFDSIFALLSKFALLNALTARELATLVVSTRCRGRLRILDELDLDLRDSTAIDQKKLVQICHTNQQVISRSFVLDAFPVRPSDCAKVLRYCPDCMTRGWHFSLFQLTFVHRCPIHQLVLRESCAACKARIPYRLAASAFDNPFICSHCHADLAPSLGEPGLKPLDGEERAVLRNAFDSAAGIAQVLRNRQPLVQLLSLPGTDRVLLSAPSPHRGLDEYARFLDALLHRLRPEITPASPTSALIEISRNQPSHALHTESRRVLKLRRGLASPGSRPGRRTGATIFPGTRWDGADRRLKDRKFESIAAIYSSIRRQVWRAVVGIHKPCARKAANQLDYDTEGRLIPTFCPLASAYLRWRLYWEGMRVPADLFRPPRHIPFGVLAWLCDRAPVAPASWKDTSEEWFTHRVFAMDCIHNFGAWTRLCRSGAHEGTTRWTQAAAGSDGRIYWGASSGDHGTGYRIFLDKHLELQCFPIGVHRCKTQQGV